MTTPAPAPFDIFDAFTPIPHPALPPPAGAPAAPPPVAGAVTTIKAPVTLPIPDEALTFVEVEEDGSPAYYIKTESHWDWPGGISGPTIGVGYDMGQVTRAEAVADWTGIVSDATLQKILAAVGLQGSAAQAFTRAHHDEITITWDQAIAEFKDHEVPKWLSRCRDALPNFDSLPGLCQGALFSLSYNRGTGGYGDSIHPRYKEMHAIKQAMIAKNFASIPALIVAMQHLWPQGGDLWKRRAHEAALFQKGLDAAAAAVHSQAPPTA